MKYFTGCKWKKALLFMLLSVMISIPVYSQVIYSDSCREDTIYLLTCGPMTLIAGSMMMLFPGYYTFEDGLSLVSQYIGIFIAVLTLLFVVSSLSRKFRSKQKL